MIEERARTTEKTMSSERVIQDEKPDNGERAIILKETKELERAN